MSWNATADHIVFDIINIACMVKNLEPTKRQGTCTIHWDSYHLLLCPSRSCFESFVNPNRVGTSCSPEHYFWSDSRSSLNQGVPPFSNLRYSVEGVCREVEAYSFHRLLLPQKRLLPPWCFWDEDKEEMMMGQLLKFAISKSLLSPYISRLSHNWKHYQHYY